ncbi:MAG: hypothetical protein EBS79_00060 [Gammaproteobacteria bacterium]|nr:hypothetical protein [Gammaproteobacteria bacterium]NBY22606.1 hypothetical protein [Gammaproteobacteria bacterium]
MRYNSLRLHSYLGYLSPDELKDGANWPKRLN